MTRLVEVGSSLSTAPGSPRPTCRRKERRLVINLRNCRYPVLAQAAEALNWTVTRDDNADWDLFWTDTSVSEERVLKLKKTQRINHFAGMHTLARKTGMARLLRRIGSHLPEAFAFMPQTWILPSEAAELARKSKVNPRWVIVKPDGSCQGKGIFLTNSAEKAAAFSPAAVAQEYIDAPFLIDGFKFDIRIFVLVTSCDPLRVYLYDEGLARFCTTAYSAPSELNATETTMHLTNYAINKKQDNFTCAEDGTSGFKRTLSSVLHWLDMHGHSSKDVVDRIARLCVSTMLAAQPTLASTARSLNITSHDDRSLASFELLGLDVILDSALKPWLLEVNHSPSFACENAIDHKLKTQLLMDTLSILHVSTKTARWLKVKNKRESAMRLRVGGRPNLAVAARPAPVDEGNALRKMRQRHEERNLGSFRLVYPAAPNAPEAELYCEIEAAAHRAQEEGEAKPVLEPSCAVTPDGRTESDINYDALLPRRQDSRRRTSLHPSDAAAVHDSFQGSSRAKINSPPPLSPFSPAPPLLLNRATTGHSARQRHGLASASTAARLVRNYSDTSLSLRATRCDLSEWKKSFLGCQAPLRQPRHRFPSSGSFTS